MSTTQIHMVPLHNEPNFHCRSLLLIDSHNTQDMQEFTETFKQLKSKQFSLCLAFSVHS